jgi:hypothetical protein
MEKEPKAKRIERKRQEEQFFFDIDIRSLSYWGCGVKPKRSGFRSYYGAMKRNTEW